MSDYKREQDQLEGMKKEIEFSQLLTDKLPPACGMNVYHVVDKPNNIGGFSPQFVSYAMQVYKGLDIVVGAWNEEGVFVAYCTFDPKSRPNPRYQECYLELHKVKEGEQIYATYQKDRKGLVWHERPTFDLGYNKSMYLVFYLVNQPPILLETKVILDAINRKFFDDYLFEERYLKKNRWEISDTFIKVAIPWDVLYQRLEEYHKLKRFEQWEQEESWLAQKKRIRPLEEIQFTLKEVSKMDKAIAYLNGEKVIVQIPVGFERELVDLTTLSDEEREEFARGYKAMLHEHSIDYSELINQFGDERDPEDR